MDDKRLEMKVGLFILAAAVSVAVLLYLMGEWSLGRGQRLVVNFSHTGNVVEGAPVKLGGITVGRVERTALLPGRRDGLGDTLPVEMRLSISKDARAVLRTDAAVTVATLGPLGEAYLELYPGSSETPLPESASIRGVDAPRLDLVANRLSNFLEAMSNAVERNPDVIAELASGIAGLTRTADGVLSENRAEIHSLMQELSQAVRDFRVIAAEVRAAVEPGGKGARLLDDAQTSARILRNELPAITSNASRTLEGLAGVTGELTPQDGQRLRAALERYSAAGERLERVATRAERILAAVEGGQGSMGGFFKDPALYQDLKALVSDLKKHPWKVLWKD